MSLARGLLIVALIAPATVLASAPEFLPYRPLYPGAYLDAAVEHDAGDESFDASGHQRDTALPNLAAGRSELPSSTLDLRMAWTFPLFEQERLPFFSTGLHTARVHLQVQDLDSRGAIADFIAAREGLARASGGFGDVNLEFGSYLSGSGAWREGRTGPLSTLLLFGLRVPVGVYERDAPASAGSNQLAAQLKLGAHAAPWSGAFFDAGIGWRVHGRNEEPAFGALAPAQAGDEALWDVQLAQRLRPRLYVSLGAQGVEGEPNRYRDPRLSTHTLDAPPPGSERVPVPGTYRDEGRSLRVAQLSLRWFVTPRMVAGLSWTHPFDGESGEFDLPLQQRSPAGCASGALGCIETPAGTVRQDGLGAARALASDRIALSLSWQFGLGEPGACAGCRD